MKIFKQIILISTLLLGLSSCERYLGYGVVMLPGEESGLESGALIKITKESKIRDTWVYNSEVEEHIEIAKWRVEFYDSQEEAQTIFDAHEQRRGLNAQRRFDTRRPEWLEDFDNWRQDMDRHMQRVRERLFGPPMQPPFRFNFW